MRFSGIIGFWEDDEEVGKGIWAPKVVERHYTGDVIKQTRKFQESNENQNPHFKINVSISIYADLYARNNLPSIRYVILNGVKFNVAEVTPDYPKILITLGGRYNENERITW